MSWLKETLKTKKDKEDIQKKIEISEEQKKQIKLKNKWGEVVTPAYQAVADWNRLELDKLLVDVEKSGIFDIRDLRISRLNCVFGYGTKSKLFELNVGCDAREGSVWYADSEELYGEGLGSEHSIEEALERIEHERGQIDMEGSKKYSLCSFLYLKRSLHKVIHEGDGDTWGSVHYPEVFSLKIDNTGTLFADDEKFCLLADLNQFGSLKIQRELERSLDLYLSSRLNGTSKRLKGD